MITLGDDATPRQIRSFLKKIDLKKCMNEKGEYYSPITGETFDSFYALAGHIGARLREIKLTELTEDRKGYVKALRRGIEPTPAQTKAHRDFMRAYRQTQREKKVNEPG